MSVTLDSRPVSGPTHPSPVDEAIARRLSHVRPPEWRNPTPQSRYNLVVIGGGSAGLIAAAGAAGLGARVALVERHLLGGDCLNVGCVPSKALIRAARAAAAVRDAARFGIHAPEPQVDFTQVMAHVHRAQAQISPHDSAQRYTDMGVDVFFGTARFTGPDSVEVDGQTLRFARALIATGSRPVAPPISGLAEAGYLTNETFFDLTKQPRRLAIIGAGPIGCELAQAFQRLGTQVTVLEIAPQILIREDADAAAIVARALLRDGVDLRLGVQVEQVDAQRDGKRIRYRVDDQTETLTVDAILVAAGRAPNLESLDLPAAGVAFHKRGIRVDETLRTTNPRIYAAGDVALKYQFTHAADASARLVLRNALFPGPKAKVSDLIIPWVTYTDPEIGHIGLYPHEAEEQGIPLDTYRVPLAEVDRAVTDGETEGFVQIHTRKGTDRIVGATVVAGHAGELMGELSLAMRAGVGLKTLADTVHPYPTQAGAIRRAADLYNRTRLTPWAQRILGWWMAFQRTR